jgi:hypothetical protein
VCRCGCAEGYNYCCAREKCFLHCGTFEWNGDGHPARAALRFTETKVSQRAAICHVRS